MEDLFVNEPKSVSEAEWKKEWVGMPEFKQEQQRPFAKIIVRFETEADLLEFEKLIGQPLTARTKSIWHPKLKRGIHSGDRYVASEGVSDES